MTTETTDTIDTPMYRSWTHGRVVYFKTSEEMFDAAKAASIHQYFDEDYEQWRLWDEEEDEDEEDEDYENVTFVRSCSCGYWWGSSSWGEAPTCDRCGRSHPWSNVQGWERPE